MFESWTPIQRYKLLHSPYDAEAASDMPQSAHFSEWFTFRRIRTTLIISALLLVVLSLSHFVTLPPNGLAPLQHTADSSSATTSDNGVRWSDFAYVQYVTNANYLCNSLMILDALYRSGAKADRIMMYPEEWHVAEGNTANVATESKLLAKARDVYQAKLVPIQVQSFEKGDATWKDSYTKLLAFNQTQYKRVMSLDSDAIVREVSVYPDLSTALSHTEQLFGAAYGRALHAAFVTSSNAASILARPTLSV